MDVLAPILTALGTFVLDTGLFLAAYRVFGTRKGPPISTLCRVRCWPGPAGPR